MLKGKRIALIGPGVMGEALLSALLARAGVAAEDLTVGGPRPERLRELTGRYGVETSTDNRAAVERAEAVVLAVKPQTLPVVLEGLSGAIPPGALVLSIVAGARLEDLKGLQVTLAAAACGDRPPRGRLSRRGVPGAQNAAVE